VSPPAQIALFNLDSTIGRTDLVTAQDHIRNAYKVVKDWPDVAFHLNPLEQQINQDLSPSPTPVPLSGGPNYAIYFYDPTVISVKYSAEISWRPTACDVIAWEESQLPRK
jgi:hypothetical protein